MVLAVNAAPGSYATSQGVYDATTQGTGKTLLSEVVSLITSGRDGALFSAPRDAEEWRKVLTSVLLEGSAVVMPGSPIVLGTPDM